MAKSVLLWLLTTILLTTSSLVTAQQPKKVARIGFLSSSFPAALSARVEAFRQGLRDLGYIEGKNIVIEYRYAEGKLDRLPDLAAELVHLKMNIILTGATDGVQAAQKASKTIPIVFAAVSDPVGSGLVSSLARPGGNVTGLTQIAPDLGGKRLELLKEAFAKVSRVAFLWNPGTGGGEVFREAEGAAKALGLKLQSLEVRGQDDFDSAFEAAKREHADALAVTSPNPIFLNQRVRIAEFAAKSRLPAMYYSSEFVEDGGLMSYAPNYADLFRRAATYVDKILKGRKPADLPVEQPTKFEFIINLKAAKQIGLTIPPNVLARADRVIK
jgi:putative tryptophan/tyrosine transport system substrate-binding protein